MEGYIKFYRSILNWEWWHDINVFRLWSYLLLSANHQDSRWKGIDVLRGQHITSLPTLEKKTGLSTQQIRTALSKLKSTGEITETVTNKYRLITLVNYDNYQGKDDESNSQDNTQSNRQSTDNQQTSNRQSTANKNDKNIKNDKNARSNKTSSITPEEFKSILGLWNSRCELKGITRMTDRRKQALACRLKEYGEESFRKLIENINASSFLKGQNDRGWTATFDWVIKPNNYVKVLEGNYLDNKPTDNTNKPNTAPGTHSRLL